jgi:hypothetical protein
VGHQDAIIDGVLVDCKSASGVGFDKFKYNKLAEDDPFGYVAQLSATQQQTIWIGLLSLLLINPPGKYVCRNFTVWR